MKRLAWLTDLHLNFVTPGHVERLCPSVAVAWTDVAGMSSGRRAWAARYIVQEGGRRGHKAIYVGGDDAPELIEGGRHLLERFRLQRRWAEEVEGFARIAARACGMARRLASSRGRPD